MTKSDFEKVVKPETGDAIKSNNPPPREVIPPKTPPPPPPPPPKPQEPQKSDAQGS